MNRSLVRTLGIRAAALALAATALAAGRADACGGGPGYIQLPASGSGFYTYSAGDKRWGRPEFVNPFQSAAADWQVGGVKPGGFSRLGVGELSLQSGGDIAGHVSHRCGIDIDVRPQSVWGYEGPLTYTHSKYSAAGTNWFLRVTAPNRFPWERVFFNDPALRGAPIYYENGHNDHWHGRFNRQNKGDCCNSDNGC